MSRPDLPPPPASDMVAEFRKNGFAIVRDLIAPRDLDGLLAELGGVFSRRARSLGQPCADPRDQSALSTLLTELFRRDPDAYISAAKQTQLLAAVHELGVGHTIVDIVRKLGVAVPAVSTRPVIHYMADHLRIAGGYHKTPIHQDWRSVQGSLDGLTIWLPLFDIGANYPLEIISGSHRRGLLPSVDDAFGHRVADGFVENCDFVPLLLQRGDVVFFSGFLVHRTGSRGGSQVRVALSYRYNNAAEPSFVDRNYPNPYSYRADMRLLRDGFPTSHDVTTVFAPKKPPAPSRRHVI